MDYTYGHNNPISYYDPTGHSIVSALKKAKKTVKSAFNNTAKAAKQTVAKAANEYKENWNSGISQLSIISIFPVLHSLIILLNSSRFLVDRALIPSSAYISTSSHSLFLLMYSV